MAIFIFKVIALVVRTVAKPLITWATYYNRIRLQESNHKYIFMKEYIIWLGQMTNYYNTKLNRKVFKLPSNDPIKKLSEDKAIEKGAECLSELIIYTILLSIPIMEWWRQSKISKLKEEIKEQSVKRIQQDVELLNEENKRLKKELKNVKEILMQINNKL